jgi:TRAP-type uncharacterized transport system fused permease subunit
MAFVLGLIFLVFARPKAGQGVQMPSADVARRRAALRLAAGAIAIAAVLYIPWIFDDLAFRVGNPRPQDVVMGTIADRGRCSRPRDGRWAGRSR